MNNHNQPPSEKPKFFQLFEERIVDGQHSVEPLIPTYPQEIDMNLALAGLEEADTSKQPDGRYHIDKDRASRLGLVANLGDTQEVNRVEQIKKDAETHPKTTQLATPQELKLHTYIDFSKRDKN